MMLFSGTQTAVVVGNTQLSYQQLTQKIYHYSTLLSNKKSPYALIYSENRLGWICSFYATWLAGMIPVPVDFLSMESDLQYIIDDCKPSIIFCSAAKKAMVEKYSTSMQIIVIDDFENDDVSSYPTDYQLNTPTNQTAVIIYTSGTTGNPKGVMLSFENLLVNIASVSTEIPIFSTKDKVLMLLPLHHIFPLMGTMIIPLAVGSSVALCPSMASEDIIQTMQTNKITIVIGVPRLYAAIHKGIMDKIHKSKLAKTMFSLAEKVNRYSFSKLLFGTVHRKFGGAITYFVSGGAALDVEVGQDFKTLGFQVLEGYGMSEAAPMISFTHPNKVIVGSAGKKLKCCSLKFVDDEILVSGKNIMQGYLGHPQETAEVLHDGWLHTGDLGYMDNNGDLFITGRKKEIIVLSNGKKINPMELELKLEATHRLIKEAGVFQVDDRLKAVVVLNNSVVNELVIKDLDKFLKWNILNIYNQNVVSYKTITELIVSPTELPRTRLGKIQRFKLIEYDTKQETQPIEIVDVKSEEFKILSAYLLQEKKLHIKPTDHIKMDLWLDSLDKVSLQVFIESTFGIKMDIFDMERFENILELCHYINQHKVRSIIEKINWAEILKQHIHIKLPATWITSNLIVKFSSLFFSLYFKFKGKGLTNIPNEPCIIVPNHQSFFDGLFVASFLGFKRVRKTFFYAKEKHVGNAFLKFIASRNNIIVMDLNNNLKESIQKMAEVLKKQKNLIIFPEGTRTKDGRLGDFKKTFAILSRELNIPIVPVTINGAYKAMPRGSFFPRPFRKVHVEFHKPIYPEKLSYDTISDMVRNCIEIRLQK